MPGPQASAVSKKGDGLLLFCGRAVAEAETHAPETDGGDLQITVSKATFLY